MTRSNNCFCLKRKSAGVLGVDVVLIAAGETVSHCWLQEVDLGKLGSIYGTVVEVLRFFCIESLSLAVVTFGVSGFQIT